MVCGIRAEHLESHLGRAQTEAKIIRAVVGNDKVRHKVNLVKLREDLDKGLSGLVRAGNLGMEGSVQERLAIAVHLLEAVEVGIGSSTGTPIYERIRVSVANDTNLEYYGRQYLGATEGELFAAACGNSLELVVMGVRGAWRMNEVNDFLRRSIRDMVQYRGEMEAFVWPWPIRHERGGSTKEELMFMVLVAGDAKQVSSQLLEFGEGGGVRMATIENFGVELFYGLHNVLDRTMKMLKSTVGYVLEVSGPYDRVDKRVILEVLYSRGIKRTVGIVKKVKGQGGSMGKDLQYVILPMSGEISPAINQVWEQVYQGKIWSISRRNRELPDVEIVDSVEGPTINWLMGEAIEGPREYFKTGGELDPGVVSNPKGSIPDMVSVVSGLGGGGIVMVPSGGESLNAVECLVVRLNTQDRESKEERGEMRGLFASMLSTLDGMNRRFEALEKKVEGNTNI